MAGKVYRLIVPQECDGLRLDQYLARATAALSRSEARKIIDVGGVHLDGRRMRRSSCAVRPGGRIEVFLDGAELKPFSLQDTDVFYRDRYLIAVNKPAGINTQPTPARFKGTLYDALLRLLADPLRPTAKVSLGMVQRLDRDTSGIMVFSIHPRAHKELTRLFAEHLVQKSYLALVAGNLTKDEGEFRSLLARQRRTNLMKSVARGGKEAITRYRVLTHGAGIDLVEVEIPTGRSHQIRVHFSEAGHPLLGDVRYGGPRQWGSCDLDRQMLHAWKLTLPHPVTRQSLELAAPVPADMQALLDHAKMETRFSVE
jgi:23S rRNA pseudouridine1911/1915/1917 synthase